MAATIVCAQGTFTPRDADEVQAWQIYKEYKESRRIEAPLEAAIKQKFGEAFEAAVGYGAILGVDWDANAAAKKKVEQLAIERKRQADLLAAWEKKYYWRYGDLRWSGDHIRDAKTNREMDRIEFAMTYFPFNYVPHKTVNAKPPPPPVKPPSAAAGATSLTLELPGYWGHLSYTITGARLDPPTGSDRGNVGGRQYRGELTGNTLTISGNAVSDNTSSGPGSGDYYELVVSVTVGKEHKEYGYIAPKDEKLSKPFSLSVPVTPGAAGNFSVRLLEQNANYGPHGWVVSGNLAAKAAGSSGVSATSKGPSVEYDTDRPGGDYRSFDLPEANFELCRSACAGDANCKAYTYVKPGVQGPTSRCWLKSSVAGSAKSTSCISGTRP
jgi:hypothetical protein